MPLLSHVWQGLADTEQGMAAAQAAMLCKDWVAAEEGSAKALDACKGVFFVSDSMKYRGLAHHVLRGGKLCKSIGVCMGVRTPKPR
jgi:hypothetical protein